MRKDEETYMRAVTEGGQDLDQSRLVDDYIDKSMKEGKTDEQILHGLQT